MSSPEGAPSAGGLCWASLPGVSWLSIMHGAWLAGDSPHAPSVGRKRDQLSSPKAAPTARGTNDSPIHSWSPKRGSELIL